MFKDKELSVFHKNAILGKARIITVILFFFSLLLHPNLVGDQLGLAQCAFLLCVFCWFFYFLIRFSGWKNRYINQIAVYEGSIDDLIEDLYSLGIELDRKIGSHYFFVRKSNTMTDIRYFVTDLGQSCKVRGSKSDVTALELHCMKNIISTK